MSLSGYNVDSAQQLTTLEYNHCKKKKEQKIETLPSLFLSNSIDQH